MEKAMPQWHRLFSCYVGLSRAELRDRYRVTVYAGKIASPANSC
jgi:hypothetical protein